MPETVGDPGKVWACDHCGLRWTRSDGVAYPIPGATETRRSTGLARIADAAGYPTTDRLADLGRTLRRAA